MKVLLLIVAINLAAALPHYQSNEIMDDDSQQGEWTMVPDGEGNFHLVNVNELEAATALERKKPLVVYFELFTRENLEGEVIAADIETVGRTNFNPKLPTRIITHGWGVSARTTVVTRIRDAYLARGDYNVITHDWSSGGHSMLYPVAKSYVPEAGQRIAELIDFLHKETGMPLESVYVMGHSLGAHVAGYGGKLVKSGRVSTIFGLDPAGPLFPFSKPDQRLNSTDAMYVEIIHSNAGLLGVTHPIGHASFYANWGKTQPGCGVDVMCSHSRPIQYLSESIAENNNFLAIRCEDYNNVLERKCGSPKLSNEVIKLGGDPSNVGLSGVFYVPTNRKSPFGIGKLTSSVSKLFNL